MQTYTARKVDGVSHQGKPSLTTDHSIRNVRPMAKALSTLLTERLEAMIQKDPTFNASQFANKVKMHRGNVYHIMEGLAPLPLKHIERWSKALGFAKGGQEYAEFVASVHMARLRLKKGIKESVDLIELRQEYLENELRAQQQLADGLRKEAIQLRAQLSDLQTKFVQLTAR